MPIYEYQCTACGHRFEQLILAGEMEPEECPACGAAIQRLISAHAVGGSGEEAPACASGACAPCGEGACPACE